MNKKTKIRFSITIFVVLFITGTTIVSRGYRKKATCEKIEVEFVESQNFITKKQVENYIYKSCNNVMGVLLDSVNSDYVEQKIETLAWVENAEVFKSYQRGQGHQKYIGKLKVEIEQSYPIARYVNRDKGFFISSSGEILPYTNNNYTNVLVISGKVSNDFAKTKLFELATFIQKSEYWKSMVQQVHVKTENQVILITRIGKQTITLGAITNLEKKFRNLHAYFKHFAETKTWIDYKDISIAFENQVICTKQ